jgi:hypothetical protein
LELISFKDGRRRWLRPFPREIRILCINGAVEWRFAVRRWGEIAKDDEIRTGMKTEGRRLRDDV